MIPISSPLRVRSAPPAAPGLLVIASTMYTSPVYGNSKMPRRPAILVYAETTPRCTLSGSSRSAISNVLLRPITQSPAAAGARFTAAS